MSLGVVEDREAATAAFDALDTALEAVIGLDVEMLCTRERLALLERCEKVRRRLPAAEHPMINRGRGKTRRPPRRPASRRGTWSESFDAGAVDD
jgi:hypothetical protein